MDPAKDDEYEQQEQQEEEESDVGRAAIETRQSQADGVHAEDGDGGSDGDDDGSDGDDDGSDGDDADDDEVADDDEEDDDDEEGDDGDDGRDDGDAGEASTAAVGKDAQPPRLCDPDMPGESRTLEEESRRGVGVESLHLGESRTLEEEEEGRGLGERQAGGERAVRSHRGVESLNLEEEWQDEDFPSPRPHQDDNHTTVVVPRYNWHINVELSITVPSSLPLSSAPRSSRRKLTAPDISLSLDRADDDDDDDDDDLEGDTPDIDVDALETPDDAESLDATGPTGELEWEDDTPLRRAPLPELSGAEEREDALGWRRVLLGETEHRVDLRAVEPYKRVLSHGGYYGDGLNAIIVFAACYLPDGKDPEYAYIMENLFLYMVSTLDRLVAEDYMIVYLNGATPRRRTPGLGWLKRCYTMIDRRLRKNLKALVIVHPSFFVRTLLALTRPFISSKFSRKVRYVHSLAELAEVIPMEHVSIPDCIQQEELDMQRRQHESDNTPCSSFFL
ncbi:unnamed protein product [Lampetra fluviatilis]